MEKEMMKKTTQLACFVVIIALPAACAPPAPAAEPVVQSNLAQDNDVLVEREAPMEEPAAEEALDMEFAVEEAVEAEMGEAGALAPAPTAMASATAGAAQEEPPAPEEGPDVMIFEDYGTNPFVDTAQDNLSTFAVDVDTGSYTLARSYLNDGILPPAEAIRLEEFVNYFDQDYPVPQQDTFDIVMDAAPTPFNAQGNLVMRIGIQGYDVDPNDRPDATLIFVIDVSGSMDAGNRLGAVKEALYTLTQGLRPDDRVGIVVYGSRGRVLLEPTPVGQTRQINRAIERLQPDGSTNAEEGLRLAYELATADFDPDRINRLILCSDGVANVGATGPDTILETVRQQARQGITLTTVGFGMGNYNDVLMEQLADDGDGQYFYVDGPEEASRIFAERLTGTLQAIALDARVQVEFNPETVAYYRLMGYENRDVADEDFRNDEIDAGEIGAGHSVTALYEIVPAEGAQGRLATVYLRWLDVDTREPSEINQSIDTSAVAPTFDDAPAHFRLDAAVAAFADLLGEGAWAQSADPATLQAVSGEVARELGDADAEEFAGLVSRALDLRQ
jgi:Ca-activated chloride channel family protein